MQIKIPLKPPLFIGSIVGILFSLIIIFFPIRSLPAQGSSTNTKPTLPISIPVIRSGPGLPIRLKISKIKIDAAIEYVGLTAKGEMGIPKLPRNVAWFNMGVRPGEIGTAAIAGHLNWYNGAKSAFANLNKLKPGDKIIVLDDNGATSTFVVRKVRVYSSKEDASEVFFSNDGKAHLNLITCVGVWNKNTKQYSQRLVVFTDKV